MCELERRWGLTAFAPPSCEFICELCSSSSLQSTYVHTQHERPSFLPLPLLSRPPRVLLLRTFLSPPNNFLPRIKRPPPSSSCKGKAGERRAFLLSFRSLPSSRQEYIKPPSLPLSLAFLAIGVGEWLERQLTSKSKEKREEGGFKRA